MCCYAGFCISSLGKYSLCFKFNNHSPIISPLLRTTSVNSIWNCMLWITSTSTITKYNYGTLINYINKKQKQNRTSHAHFFPHSLKSLFLLRFLCHHHCPLPLHCILLSAFLVGQVQWWKVPLAFVCLGQSVSSISEGRHCWVWYCWLAVFFFQYFECVIPALPWSSRFLLRNPLRALQGFPCDKSLFPYCF